MSDGTVPLAPATCSALELTPEEQLEAAAQITDQDKAEAGLFWRIWGTPLLNALLNAEKKPLDVQRTPLSPLPGCKSDS
jgi:hypothetical protein